MALRASASRLGVERRAREANTARRTSPSIHFAVDRTSGSGSGSRSRSGQRRPAPRDEHERHDTRRLAAMSLEQGWPSSVAERSEWVGDWRRARDWSPKTPKTAKPAGRYRVPSHPMPCTQLTSAAQPYPATPSLRDLTLALPATFAARACRKNRRISLVRRAALGNF
ncbi:hypothetical protein BC567DRAFT_247548 [Phyllosticta citribraziliensis]